jgi:hypothetical protein
MHTSDSPQMAVFMVIRKSCGEWAGLHDLNMRKLEYTLSEYLGSCEHL